MIIVTGGAGFIGSVLVQELNSRGKSDILIVDVRDHVEKEKNLKHLRYSKFLDRDDFMTQIQSRSLKDVTAVFHLGACSSTTETNESFLRKNNFEYTRELAVFTLEAGARFIYASSAATYGNGEQGYSDDEPRLEILKPLNLYGHSKHKLDLWARDQGWLNRIVGLKYFNVFGPNEYHKEDMRSMVLKGYLQARDTGRIRLFKSYHPDYEHGGQVRDFIYIKDAVAMTMFFYDHPKIGGIFNVGTGRARSWNDLAASIFSAMGSEAQIEYIEMPESLREQYQYHTCAEIGKIRAAGFDQPIRSLEDGVRDYVQNHLTP